MTDLPSPLLSSASQGVLWALLATGVYVILRTLGVAGLTAEGSFPLGAGITAVSITSDHHPLTACLLGFLGGVAAGPISGLLHTKLKTPVLLVGIITVISSYSATSRVTGAPSISLLGQSMIFHWVEPFGVIKDNAVLIVGLPFALIVVCLFVLFLHTETGLAIRATGDNLATSEASGINTDDMRIIGYMVFNGCVTPSGSLLTQNNGFADLNSGIRTIVIGLASIIIAGVLLCNQPLFLRLLTAVLGAVTYRLTLALVFELNIEPSDSELASALVLVICPSFLQIQQKFHLPQEKKDDGVR